MAQQSPPDAAEAAARFEEMQASPEFARLRHTLRRFVFPMTVAFLSWYLLYVILTAYARDFMNITVFGHVNIGFILGWAQFVTTFGIALLYSRYADRQLDPQAEVIRAELEDGK